MGIDYVTTTSAEERSPKKETLAWTPISTMFAFLLLGKQNPS
jgi:hypothetical protein